MEELFAGPRAEEAKVRAFNIAKMFEFRLRGRGRFRSSGFLRPALTGVLSASLRWFSWAKTWSNTAAHVRVDRCVQGFERQLAGFGREHFALRQLELRGRGRARGPAGTHDSLIVYRKRALRRPLIRPVG